jgi:endogenous inhibitor of DNA gyrase (YacG/DUF329 family)
LQTARDRGEEVLAVSFDHDLGLTLECPDCGAPAHDLEKTPKCCKYCYHDDTTRRVARWMAEHDAFPQTVYVHTANFTGREYLEGIINTYGPGVANSPAK